MAAATSQKWDVLTEFEVQHMPVVFVDRHFDGLEGPFVGVDNRKGAFIGATHLIECGHRKIGILAGFQRLSTMRERVASRGSQCRCTARTNSAPLSHSGLNPSLSALLQLALRISSRMSSRVPLATGRRLSPRMDDDCPASVTPRTVVVVRSALMPRRSQERPDIPNF